jgi:hypothetical protein
MPDKIYHIYLRGHCIYHCLKEEEFEKTWSVLNRLAEFLSNTSELSYEELSVNKEISLNSSH